MLGLRCMVRLARFKEFPFFRSTLNANEYLSRAPQVIGNQKSNFHSSNIVCGFEEFWEPKKPNEVIAVGRSWQAAELRRKVIPF